MNENTRKYYITQGEEFERASEYEKALSSYLEAFSVNEITEEDDKELFSPGYLEDKIAFLAYRLGNYRTALTYGAKAYRSNPSDDRMRNNIPFYTDAILYVNPKERMDDIITDYIKSNFDHNGKILDVGPYDGRWSYRLFDTFKHMDAVEAFEPYVERFSLKSRYENIFISDVLDFEFDYYDVIIIGDVLEHLTIEQSHKLIEKIYNKCGQLIIIVPYEFPQDEYDENQYQIHKQEDLTDEIFKQRYPEFDLMLCDELRGCYVKKGSISTTDYHLPILSSPKTFICGMTYLQSENYGLAAGVFSQSLEKMPDKYLALMKYNLGICYKKLDKTMESLGSFTKAIEIVPNYRSAYIEAMRILEKFEFWPDLEFYIKKALDNLGKEDIIGEGEDPYWKSLLLIQMTLALSKQKRNFEAYGYAALALEAPMEKDRREIAEYNFNELKKELWSTLQIND